MNLHDQFKKVVDEIIKRVKNPGGDPLYMEDIAAALDMSREYFSRLYNGKHPIRQKHINDLVLHYPQIKDLASDFHLGEPEPETYQVKRRRHKENSVDQFLVPFVDIPAQAGYKKAYQQRDYIASLKKYPILPDVDPTGAVWRYFQVEGDSMEPEIMSGDVLLCSQVNREDWAYLRDKHTHVVVTDEQLWIKDIHKEDDEQWILLSQNLHYKPFVVKVEEVKQVWVMRRHVKARAKKHVMYDMDKVRKMLNLDRQQSPDRIEKQKANLHPFEPLKDKKQTEKHKGK
jgi:signal peptidase I